MRLGSNISMIENMTKNNKAVITGIGTANPEFKQFQAKTAEIITNSFNLKPSERRLLKSIYRGTGIEQRHSVLSDFCKSFGEFEFFPNEIDAPFPTTAARMQIYKDNALDLALKAIENCLSELENFHVHQITHVITVSCTGMYAPGIDIEIVHRLNLHSTTNRTAINFMGCYGAFNAIKIADAICKSNPDATVLIVCVEICTIHFQKSMHLDNIISNSLFADGAACVIIQSQTNRKKYFSLENFHNDLMPQSNDAMAWHIGDNGFDIVLSSYVPDIIRGNISSYMEKLFHQYKLNLSDIDFFAIHPGGLKILEACETALNISKENNKYAYQTLRNYGNMSSVTILFVLKAIWDDIQYSEHHKNIFSCAFGPGLTLESMLLKSHCVN